MSAECEAPLEAQQFLSRNQISQNSSHSVQNGINYEALALITPKTEVDRSPENSNSNLANVHEKNDLNYYNTISQESQKVPASYPHYLQRPAPFHTSPFSPMLNRSDNNFHNSPLSLYNINQHNRNMVYERNDSTPTSNSYKCHVNYTAVSSSDEKFKSNPEICIKKNDGLSQESNISCNIKMECPSTSETTTEVVKLDSPMYDEPSADSDNSESEAYEHERALSENQTSDKQHICDRCFFSTDSELEYKKHSCLSTIKCYQCSEKCTGYDNFARHLSEKHQLADLVSDDIAKPKLNSQGKYKIFKCKACDFKCHTKVEFWLHQRTHMKQDKMLVCDECPFVTEYKHHLDYHKKNHSGVKPYICEYCSYSCVNKSMLNSHQKSHSDMYQYRCDTCPYVTKYLHSLKLHLRKYKHTPQMVLNADGTPNPIPVIDVYGTRRGPKIKKDENGMPIIPPQYKFQAEYVRAQMQITGKVPLALPPTENTDSVNLNSNLRPTQPLSMCFGQQYQNRPILTSNGAYSESRKKTGNSSMNETLSTPSKRKYESENYASTYNIRPEETPSVSHASALKGNEQHREPPYTNPLVSLFYQQLIASQMLQNPTYNFHQNNPTYNLQHIFSSVLPPNNINNAQDTRVAINEINDAAETRLGNDNRAIEVSRSRPETPEAGETSILGTTPDISINKGAIVNDKTPVQDFSPPISTISPPTSDTSTPPVKNRRKGPPRKKIDTIALRLSGIENEDLQREECNNTSESTMMEKDDKVNITKADNNRNDKSLCDTNASLSKANTYFCKFCEIQYPDYVLYNMHMGFHSHNDPFECNRCGHKCANSVDFSVHLMCASHN